MRLQAKHLADDWWLQSQAPCWCSSTKVDVNTVIIAIINCILQVMDSILLVMHTPGPRQPWQITLDNQQLHTNVAHTSCTAVLSSYTTVLKLCSATHGKSTVSFWMLKQVPAIQ
jgi:hypothetical protein